MSKPPAPQNVYFLAGSEESLKKDFIEKIKKNILGQESLATNLEIFYSDNIELEKVFEALLTNSFFEAKRIVVIKNIEKLKKEEKEALAEYVQNPGVLSVLILETSESNLSKNKFYKILQEHAQTFLALAPNPREKAQYLREHLAAYGITLTPDAQQIIHNQTPASFDEYRQFVDKLICFCIEKKKVNREDIFAVYKKPEEYRAFEIQDCFLRKDIAGALKIINNFKESGGEIYELMGLLGWVMRKAGSSPRALSSGGGHGARTSFGESSRDLSRRKFKKNLGALSRMDYAIKTGKIKSLSHIDCFLITLFCSSDLV